MDAIDQSESRELEAPKAFELVGPPRVDARGPCSFHKSFRRRTRSKTVSLGDFFHLRIPPSSPSEENAAGMACIGELLLVWSSSVEELCACRLYFRPEDTPGGRRMDVHGQDEVIALSETAIIQLRTLVQWMHVDDDPKKATEQTPSKIEATKTEGADELRPHGRTVEEEKTSVAVQCDGPSSTINCRKQNLKESTVNTGLPVGVLENDKEGRKQEEDETRTERLVILPYGRYCRFASIQRRLGSPAAPGQSRTKFEDVLKALVGGSVASSTQRLTDCRVLFCRDTFEQHLLIDRHPDLCNDHRVPSFIKDRLQSAFCMSKIKKAGSSDSGSSQSGSWSSSATNESNEESTIHRCPSAPSPTTTVSAINETRPNLNGFVEGTSNGLAKNHLREQLFLQRLFEFMRKRNTPIERVPSLGFKQVNLYSFYTHAKKLGGYEKITVKKLWKRIYDKLGGNPGSTSAATTTRRHYERLLLPFERQDRINELRKEQERTTASIESPSRSNSSNLSTTKSSSSIPDRPLPCKSFSASMDLSRQAITRFHQQNELRKRLKDTRAVEKERMWDEIRRQNALERDRLRQLSASSRFMLADGSQRSALKTRDPVVSSRPVNVVVPLEPTQQRPMAMRNAEDANKRLKTEMALTNGQTSDSHGCIKVTTSRSSNCVGSSSTTTDARSVNNGDGVGCCSARTYPGPRMLSVIQRTRALVLMGSEAVTLPPFAASNHSNKTSMATVAVAHGDGCNDGLCSLSDWQREFCQLRSSKSEHLIHPHARAGAFPVSPLLHKFPRHPVSWNDATTRQTSAEATTTTMTTSAAKAVCNGHDNEVLDLTMRQ